MLNLITNLLAALPAIIAAAKPVFEAGVKLAEVMKDVYESLRKTK